MNKDNKLLDKNSPEQIKKRNRKAKLLTALVIIAFVSATLLIRYIFLNKGLSFGNVEGVSTSESVSLTKINFINSGVVKGTKTFGDISSPFAPDSSEKFWIRFTSGDKTIVGFTDTSLKFTKVYELPATVNLLRLFNDDSILFTDEPLKQEPALYYQSVGGDIIKFSSLNIQDTYQSIYFEPSEKLIYYLGRDNSNTYFVSSVNEKGVESSLFKTGDLTTNAQIQFIDNKNLYLKDGDVCFALDFAIRKMIQNECWQVKKSDLDYNFSTNPKIQTVQLNDNAGQILKIQTSGVQEVLYTLNQGQVISNLTYSNNKILFVRASLNPVGENQFLSKDMDLEVLDLSDGKTDMLTSRFPSENSNGYYIFGDKYLASSNSNLMYYFKEGLDGQVYIGDVAPVSFANVTKYWINVDLGMTSSNLRVLRSNYVL